MTHPLRPLRPSPTFSATASVAPEQSRALLPPLRLPPARPQRRPLTPDPGAPGWTRRHRARTPGAASVLLASPADGPGPGAGVRDCRPATRAPDCPVSLASSCPCGRRATPACVVGNSAGSRRRHSRRSRPLRGGPPERTRPTCAPSASRDASLPPGGTQTSVALMCEQRRQRREVLLPVGDQGIRTARAPPIRRVLEAPTQSPLLPAPGPHRWVRQPPPD